MFETQGGGRNRTRDLHKKESAFILPSDHWTDMWFVRGSQRQRPRHMHNRHTGSLCSHSQRNIPEVSGTHAGSQLTLPVMCCAGHAPTVVCSLPIRLQVCKRKCKY